MVVKWQFEDYWKGQGKTVTYRYSGAAIAFTVPDTVTSLKATLRGGSGGGENIDPVGEGGYVVVQFDVTPGETLHLRVGGNGGRITPGSTGAIGGFNGGGNGGNSTASSRTAGYAGGGATDIRHNGDTLSNRVAVAAGGGGNSGENISHRGGVGGDLVGGKGYSSAGPGGDNHYYAGSGGTQFAGGAAGPGGAPGSSGTGGNGCASSLHNGAGGGGGGLYGGGGGGEPGSTGDGGAGGGGSNGVAAGIQLLQSAAGKYGVYPDQSYISLEYAADTDIYVWEINANEGGSPSVTKNIAMSQNVGPNRNNLLQEGQSQAPIISFSGVIISQSHYEALEFWFDKRILIKLTDDLGREFYGVFSQFNPKRQRRRSHAWYHQYEAQFTLSAYKSASGDWVYGRID